MLLTQLNSVRLHLMSEASTARQQWQHTSKIFAPYAGEFSV